MSSCLKLPNSCNKQTHLHWDSESAFSQLNPGHIGQNLTSNAVTTDLVVCFAVFPDDLYPVQHVLPVLRLQQVFTEILGGQSQGMLSLGLTVCNVHQAAPDADWLFILGSSADHTPTKQGLPLVFIDEEWLGTEHRKDSLPRTHATSHLLWRKDEMWCESSVALNAFLPSITF